MPTQIKVPSSEEMTMQQEPGTRPSVAPRPLPLSRPQAPETRATIQAAEIDLSHELRTALAIITLLSGNLDLLYDRLDDRERRRMIRDIRKQTQKVNDLVANALLVYNEQDVATR